jgi:HNH endonuclease
MTDDKLINDFNQEVHCIYEKEEYSVRDNGAVLKHAHIGKRPRPTDNQWTFGKLNSKTGYLEIVTVRVHRIVATAFHGEPATKGYVVDHIDTNKHNNRPENLRWVTRLENILLNPITVRRIELACRCSVEEFLSDPSKFRDRFQEPNYQWMCTVSKEDAQSSLERMLAWVKSDKLPSGGTLGDWIFNRSSLRTHFSEIFGQVEIMKPITIDTVPNMPDTIKAETLNASQRNWRTPSEFPCCPQQHEENPLITYMKNLKIKSIFCRNEIYSSVVSKSALSEDNQSLFVISEMTDKDAFKPWVLAKITYENNLFVHENLGSYFDEIGVEKQFCLTQGREWTGGETFDDYAS